VSFEDEDRRSVRTVLRGAVAGSPARERLAGLLPTPGLPERALEQLASLAAPGEIAAQLAVWGHPFGPALLSASAADHPDLTRIELALHRCFAGRAVRGARQGGRALRVYVAESIDLLNAEAMLELAAGGHELVPQEVILDGGRGLTRPVLAAAAGAGSAARDLLASAVRGTDLAPMLEAISTAGELELLQARIAAWRRRALADPVGIAPLLEYLLRLRAETVQLHWLIWSAALGMPPRDRARRLIAA
jgi:vacuolar-type H+-ATPase subunit C/Vma6